jgi:hypothetical protein
LRCFARGYFDGNLTLVAAAYNAGPDAVFRWLNAPEKIGIDAFVARIPFDETRNYVERVLGNLARYQYWLAELCPQDDCIPSVACCPPLPRPTSRSVLSRRAPS